MLKHKALITGLGVAAAVGGWALFRPELLFVNKEVHETIPVSGNAMAMTEATGMFTSQAHETTGTAEIVKIAEKQYLKLNGFSTSNGPDVRLYITDGGNPSKSSVSLGSLKANKGDQVYELPANFDPTTADTVSIWCERFAVGFGKADLKKVSALDNGIRLAGFSGRTEVTFGKVMGDAHLTGRVALVEENGKRFAEVQIAKLPANFSLKLIKKETLAKGALPMVPSVDLLLPMMGKKVSRTPLDKEIDLWLYRSVAIIDNKTNTIVAFVNLRSAQEKPAMIIFA